MVTRRVSIWVLCIAVLVLAGAMLAARAGGVQPAAALPHGGEGGADRPITSLRDLNEAFVELAEAVNPAVATVFTERVLRVRPSPGMFFDHPFEDFFGEFFQRPREPRSRECEYRQQGLGSGVVATDDGFIITNNHVIEGADTINVRLIDGRPMPAEVVGADAKTDIAVIKVDADDLVSIEIGDSDRLRVGEMVLAVGSPLSPNLAHSVTSGIVSAKGRSNVGLADYEDFIQTDAAINPGNSGGALINLDGELVGINTAIASRSGGYQGIGFAVPSNMARRVMESLIEHGTVVRGWLGIYIQDIDEALAAAMDLEGERGALVSDLSEDGPAEKAGVQQGDIIVTLDDEPKELDAAEKRGGVAAARLEFVPRGAA
jgi:serine protease Do